MQISQEQNKNKRLLEIGTQMNFPVYQCLLETSRISNIIYTGIDIDPQVRNQAQRIIKHPDKYPNFTFVITDTLAEYIPFQDKAFDEIHCHMLQIRKNKEYYGERAGQKKYSELIKEILRLLKLGGDFYISADHTFFLPANEDYKGLQKVLEDNFSEVSVYDSMPFSNHYSNWSIYMRFFACCKK